MINASNTLQGNPVLEPENVFFAFALTKDGVQLVNKSPTNKVIDDGPRLGRDIARFRVSCYRSLDPDTDMDNALSKSIRPVVTKNHKIIRLLEWNRVTKLEGWRVRRRFRRQRCPMKTFLDNKIGNAAISGLDVGRPCNIASEI